MIKNWVIFNESVKSLSRDMAREIVNYFGENCYSDETVLQEFNKIFQKTDLSNIVMYETSYEEMKQYGDILYKKSKENRELELELVNIYNLIREDISIFPKFYEIEDIYLDLLESKKFNLHVEINSPEKKYIIKLIKWDKNTIDDFLNLCKTIEGSLKRLENSKYRTTIKECNYNQSYIESKIELKAKK